MKYLLLLLLLLGSAYMHASVARDQIERCGEAEVYTSQEYVMNTLALPILTTMVLTSNADHIGKPTCDYLEE